MRTPRALLTKVLISFACSSVAFLLLNLLPAGETSLYWSVGGAIFIAGVVFITQFLIDLDQRLDGVEVGQRDSVVRNEHMLRETFLKIDEATELFGLVEASALRTDSVVQMVRYATTLDPNAPENVFEKLIDGPRVGVIAGVDMSTVDGWRVGGGIPRI